MDVFKHAKIARWRHCNADNLKTLKTNYMLIRLLCVYRMTTYVRKILLLNSKQLQRKQQKNLRGYFFAAPCRSLDICAGVNSRVASYATVDRLSCVYLTSAGLKSQSASAHDSSMTVKSVSILRRNLR